MCLPNNGLLLAHQETISALSAQLSRANDRCSNLDDIKKEVDLLHVDLAMTNTDLEHERSLRAQLQASLLVAEEEAARVSNKQGGALQQLRHER